jgi:signal transduction histidine kinase/ligand-binding sensor domain-containing protein
MSHATRRSHNFSRTCGAVARAVVAVALLMSCESAYSGTAQDLPLSLMSHKTWTARDGAPQGVRALAQAQDGTLWIGTEGGLFTFDGRTFRPFRPPPGEPNLTAGPVHALQISRDGALWAATTQGIVRITSGHVTLHQNAGDKPIGTVLFLAEASDGSMWGSGRGALFRVAADGTEHVESAPLPVSTNPIGGIFIDSCNTLWIGQSGKLYRRPLDQAGYTPTDVQVDYIFKFAEVADRSLWITDVDTKLNVGRHQRVDPAGELIATVPDSVMAFGLLPTPDNSVIISTQGFGLRRFREDQIARGKDASRTQSPDTFTHVDGLSADETRVLLLDTDGSIWSGGRRGLDRFRPAQLTPFSPEAGKEGDSSWSVCANPQGEVWVATSHALYKATAGAPQSFANAQGSSVFCGRDGDVWWIGSQEIWNEHSDRISHIAPIPGVIPYGYRQVVTGPEDTLFAIAYAPPAAAGLWKYQQAQWSKLAGTEVAGQPLSEYIDSHDRLWLGHRKGLIRLPLEDRVFSSGKPGLDGVYAFLDSSRGIFAAGGNGLAVLRETAFEMLNFADAESSRGVGGLVESVDGDLWLNASRGIVRVSASELETALKDPSHAMKSELINEGEFVGPVDLAYRSNAARDAQGNLWFATLNGVFHIDPAHLIPNTHPPVVSIRTLTVDGKPLAANATIEPNPQTLVIQYLGVNLTIPERVTYKYRLEGLEEAWQDAGHRTEAIYAQLPPGTYTFHVMASNGDDAWTAAVSTPTFTIAPAFNQTVWFKLLVICAVVLILFGALALRFRAIARGIRRRAEARAEERIRIARDLHDTLLQGVQGLLLNVHVAAQQTPEDAPSKQLLQRALSNADTIIIEGRDRLSRLRADHLTDAELVGSIESVGHDLATGDGTEFCVKRSGAPVLLHAHVADETFHIAREALTNAFRHAKATQIKVELSYGQRFFGLSCEDNGCGFSPPQAESAGHWGIKGMIERAAQLGGNLQCRSEPMCGTSIALEIPSYRAYRGHSRLMFYLRKLKGSSTA